MRSIRYYGLMLLMLACDTVLAQQTNYSNGAFERLNQKFRALYADARSDRILDVSPVVIARGDSAVLIRHGERFEGTVVHPNYHDLKTVAHIPLGIFCVLSNREGEKLSAKAKEKLREFRTLMVPALDSVPRVFETPIVRDRQTKMLSQCVDFTDSILAAGACNDAKLDQFIDEARSNVLKNVEGATRLRIDNYHQQMKQWRKILSDAEWKRLYVIIPGAALPRKNSMAVQYFSKALQEAGEGKRIIYAESQFDESQDMLLLGTHILDAQAAKAFFDDPWRLQRDMLASAADSYLDTLDFDDLILE